MTEGHWDIWPHPSGPPTRIPVKQFADGSTKPSWWENETGLTFVYQDGRRNIYPWGAIREAHYTPPS